MLDIKTSTQFSCGGVSIIYTSTALSEIVIANTIGAAKEGKFFFPFDNEFVIIKKNLYRTSTLFHFHLL